MNDMDKQSKNTIKQLEDKNNKLENIIDQLKN